MESEFDKAKCRFGISMLEILCVPILTENGQVSSFGLKFGKKWILESEFQKSNSGFGITNLEILYPLIIWENEQVSIFWLRFVLKWILGLKNLSEESESASLRHYVCQFWDKMDKFGFLCLNLPKNGFWSWNFKNLSLHSESVSSKYYVHQFSDKTDNL